MKDIKKISYTSFVCVFVCQHNPSQAAGHTVRCGLWDRVLIVFPAVDLINASFARDSMFALMPDRND